jgi:hypothetical protein
VRKWIRLSAAITLLATVSVMVPRPLGAESGENEADENEAPCGTTYDYEYLSYDHDGPVVFLGHGGSPPDSMDTYSLDNVKTHEHPIDGQYARQHRFLVFWPWHRSCSAH